MYEIKTFNYVDDIIIHTNTWAKHVLVLGKVFHKLSEAGITVKPSKCYLGYATIDFVGHRIGKGEIRTQSDKVDKVKHATIPTTVTQVRSFLGLLVIIENVSIFTLLSLRR